MSCFSTKPRVRYVYLIWTLLELVCFGAIIYGWPALVYVLKEEGIFERFCEKVSNTSNIEPDCVLRDERFNMYFTIITSVGFGLTLFVGYFYHKYGTRKARIAASLSYASGCVMLALSDKETDWLLCIGGIFMLPAGYTFLLTSYQQHLWFPQCTSTIIGLMAGSFDSSSVILLVVKTLHMNGITRKASFLAMAGLSLTTLISTYVIHSSKIEFDTKNIKENKPEPKATEDNKREFNNDMIILNNAPKQSVSYEETMKVDSISENKNDTNRKTESYNDIEKHTDGKEYVHTKTKSLKDNIFSMLYLTFVAWHVLTYLRFVYFIGTIFNTIEKLTNGDKTSVSNITNVVSITTFCGFFTSFASGFMYDFQRRIFKGIKDVSRRNQMSSILPLSATSTFAVVLSLLAFVQHEYVIFSIADLGFLMPLTGLVANIVAFLQYALFHWENSYRNANLHVNIVLTVVSAASFVHPINVYWKTRTNTTKSYDMNINSDQTDN